MKAKPMRSLACLLCAASMLMPPNLAMAFCFVPQPRLACAEYFASQLVVEATLAQVKVIGDESDPLSIQAHVYTLTVNKVFRGKTVDNIQVYDGNDSGRATFDWERGKKYLLFLFYLPGKNKNLWALDSCGNSGPLDKAKAALSEIEAIKGAHGGGAIYGVVSQQALSTPISGVRVDAHGMGQTYQAITNEKGEFEIKVPAGRYSLSAFKSGTSFSKADISYADPKAIRIESGGCVQVQFAEVEQSH